MTVPSQLALLALLTALAALAGCGNGTSTGAPSPGEELACALPLPPPGSYAMTEEPCSESSDERIVGMSDEGIALTSQLGLAPGRYATPATSSPTQLVVFFHGHQNDSCSWRNHMRKVTDRGAVAVAMDYTGQSDKDVPPYGVVENWGWFVRSGAADSVLATQYFMDRYPTVTQVFNFGASMGGNTSGYAIYLPDAVRADCSPIWDYWVVAEGVHNLTEEYTGARLLAGSGNTLAAQAQLEIEEENGGTLEEVPDRYSEITNALHAMEMGYLKGAVLTHGASDQTVPVDQSRQMAENLRVAGVPAHVFIVTPSDHAWEGSDTLQVMKVALDELFRLMDGGAVADGETPVPGPE